MNKGKSYLNNKSLTRGIRNNNPFNLVRTAEKWQGKIKLSENTDERFEQFVNVRWGIRAGLRDIVNDINKGKNTVVKLISEFAPKFENDTENYINSVAFALGIGKNDRITVVNSKFLFLIARAIITKENGKDGKYVTDTDINVAIANLGTFNGSSVKFQASPKEKLSKMVLPLLVFFCSVLVILI